MSLHRVLLAGCMTALLALAALSPAHADSRDNWLAALTERTERLASIDPTRSEAFRETAVILAEEMNRFTIEETEIRKDDKVPPPDRRSGEGTENGSNAHALGDVEAGSPVSLSKVPNAWFNYHITEAKRLLTHLIAKIDDARKGTVPYAELRVDAVELDRMLDRLNRPPRGR